ncbi:MAG: 50S ribosomal protein L22 [Nitrospirae bacterium]|nr:50S ribosomal protein L22 [Nitrospirota bacterium]
MEAKAILRYARVAPRKARRVVDVIRGKRVEEALHILKFLPQHVALSIGKVVRSAVANAEQGKVGDVDTLRITQAYVDQGPAFKRSKAGPMGRGMPRKKFTSHITVILKGEQGKK